MVYKVIKDSVLRAETEPEKRCKENTYVYMDIMKRYCRVVLPAIIPRSYYANTSFPTWLENEFRHVRFLQQIRLLKRVFYPIPPRSVRLFILHVNPGISLFTDYTQT